MSKRHGSVLLALSLGAASCTPRADVVNHESSAAPAVAASSAPPTSPAPPALSSAPPAPSAAPTAPAAGSPFERRCGWVDNPTPANWWITDRDGEWEIGVQGGHQAKGDLPDFGKAWVETNVHYGYGCACMDVRVERPKKRVLELRNVKVLPLSRCRGDRSLPRR